MDFRFLENRKGKTAHVPGRSVVALPEYALQFSKPIPTYRCTVMMSKDLLGTDIDQWLLRETVLFRFEQNLNACVEAAAA